MNPSQSGSRRRQKAQLGAESLEARELLTGGAGNTFAIIPGTIAKAGETVDVKFTIDSTHFTLPKGKLALGVDVVGDPNSPVKPFIASVTNPHGEIIPQAFHSIYDPHATHKQVATGKGTSAVLAPVSFFPDDPSKPATYSVQVQGLGDATGPFLLGFYLPGDANGDGTVDKADKQLVRSELGSRAGSARYTFDADANRDGRIGRVDLAYVQQNTGVTVTVSPVVAANLDPASVTNAAARTTNTPSARFTGTATPGAAISYTNTSVKGVAPFTTTADGTGNYAINVALVPGANVFEVKSVDAFGQTITGKIAGVTYAQVATVTAQ